MADKRKILLDSIQKLRGLNVSDDEIVSHLMEYGIPEAYIRSLLAGEPEAPVSPAAKKAVLAAEEELSAPEFGDLKARFLKKKPEAKEKPVAAKKPKAAEEPAEDGSDSSDSTNAVNAQAGLNGLWEKGIMKAVTDSLSEMKQVRDDLDANLEKRVNAVLAKEASKMTALQENTRALLMAKMNAEMEKKSKELVATLDERIADLKKTRDEVRHEQELLKTEKRISSELFKQLSDELSHSKELRDKSLNQFNSDWLRTKSDIAIALEDARKKLLAVEDRANRTLQLETQVIEGMVSDAGNRIDRMTIKKFDELASDVQSRLDELDQMKTRLDLDSLRLDLQNIKDRLGELELSMKRRSS